MVEKAAAPANGAFSQKALIVVMGGVMTLLIAFFIWLATQVNDIQVRLAVIKDKVDSLIETRSTQAAQTADRNTRRLEQLENDANNPRAEKTSPSTRPVVVLDQ